MSFSPSLSRENSGSPPVNNFLEIGQSSDTTCCICLNPLGREVKLIKDLPCNHQIHKACAKALAQFQQKCPLCRNPVAHNILDSQFRVRPPSPIIYEEEPEEDGGPYNDDEPFREPAPLYERAPLELTCITPLTKTSPNSEFDGLIKISAPKAEGVNNPQTSADVVVVADVSGSMENENKIQNLKATLNWLAGNLEPHQRLSLITFNGYARRVTPLTVMNEEGKHTQSQAVRLLEAAGGTDIGKALEVANRVLCERNYQNPVSLVVLVTDGQDNDAYESTKAPIASIQERAHICFMGLGEDHDARLLSEMQERASGTFVYCPDAEAIPGTVGGFVGAATKAAAIGVKALIQYNNQEETLHFPLLTEEQEHYTLITCSLQDDEPFVQAKISYKPPGSDVEQVVEYTGRRSVLKDEVAQEDLVLIDMHKNRRRANIALKEAVERAQKSHFEEARKLLEEAITAIKGSISKDTPLALQLIKDCEKALTGMNEEHYNHGGSQVAYSARASNLSQSGFAPDSIYATPSARHASQVAHSAVISNKPSNPRRQLFRSK